MYLCTGDGQAGIENIDTHVRCVENNMMGKEIDQEIVNLKNLVIEAEKDLEKAEIDVANKKEKLKKLQSKLQDNVIKNVSNLKAPVAVDKSGADTKGDIGR